MIDITLNNGVKMPVLGLGVYKTTDPDEMQESVASALEAGYTSFDTAQMYKNEHLMGQSLRRCGADRSKLFITSKVDVGNMGRANTLATFEQSLRDLQTDYVDLFLIHWPGQKKPRLQETWQTLEELYEQKRTRTIGVCNCTPRHLEWILECAHVTPAINQVERHPRLNQKPLQQWCEARGITMEAWSPLMRGSFDIPELRQLAEKYGKTPAQVILRWDIQSGFVVIPKSVHRARVFENFDVFDFALSPEDMQLIDGLNNGLSTTKRDSETYDF